MLRNDRRMQESCDMTSKADSCMSQFLAAKKICKQVRA